MRIISGRFGGRKLKSFKAPWIRPTSDVVKGSLFNSLQGEIQDAIVLDLFSGTGNLAFEALSRGAKRVDVVESHSGSLKIIRENAAHLEVNEELNIIKADVFDFLKNLGSIDYDVVLIDPPFTEKIADKVMQHLAKNAISNKNLVIAIESSKHEPIGERYESLVRSQHKHFGDKNLSFFRLEK